MSGLRTDDNPAVARGYALALGVLPRKLAGRLIQAIQAALAVRMFRSCSM